MIIRLGQRRTVAGKSLLANFVGFQDECIRFGVKLFHPRQKRRAEVKTYLGIIIDDIDNVLAGIKNAGSGIGGITLGADPLVPIAIRLGGILELNVFKPGIFSRRLIEMTVDTDETLHDFLPVCRPAGNSTNNPST